ncbi:transporter substrate-binding domain-containing protein [Aliagarivorans taiwanensis]|uniref:transporter substrate-binding domain-containing protein n=1 Tax=Aliagarivorans taiwanensis TaxID=561966 RepID=UPI000419CED8|nr:transporter substrate-binding domain-containing protein [Aliagarivorans taiwanensis]
MTLISIRNFVFLLVCCISFSSLALDVVRYNPPHSEKDKRNDYPLSLLTAALEVTKSEYGDYRIDFAPFLLQRERALKELLRGEIINVYNAPFQKHWEETLPPIYFPILRGLLNYRLLLITRQNESRFSALSDVTQLKSLRAGLGSQWSTTKVFRELEYTVVTSNNYDGLFGMLHYGRFDYFVRGINEVFPEYQAYRTKYPSIVVEQTKALYVPLPMFFFVSPQEARLKERIEKGLWSLHESGELKLLFDQFYGDDIRQAGLKHRLLLTVGNPFLSPHPIYQDKSLWVVPDEY